MKKFVITEKELKCINIMILSLNEAINRDTFTNDEIYKIVKTINILTSN